MKLMMNSLLSKSKIDVPDMLLKGTVMVLVTFTAGFLFGKSSMMIAFVILLGANTFEKQNLRVQTVRKIAKLILIDTLIVCLAFLASRNRWWGIPINMATLFVITYYFVSPYDQMAYKTFIMLYVFSQYNTIELSALPSRLLLVVFVLVVMLGTTLIKQHKNKALLDPNIGKAWEVINEQLKCILEGHYDEALSSTCNKYMNEVAHSIYLTGYRRYLTTYVGKIQFQFYMNISYFNVLLVQLSCEYQRGRFDKKALQELIGITEVIDSYFKRQITRTKVIRILWRFLEEHSVANGFEEEIVDMIYGIYSNFVELNILDYKTRDKLYYNWQRSNLEHVQMSIKTICNPKSISFNFAMRMSFILSVSLSLADLLGFYKIIWAVIPIISITAPYYEDTIRKKKDRIKSNVLAAIIVGIVINVIGTWWINLVLLIGGYYLIYAFNDYYRISFFLTIVSMSLSAFSSGVNVLVFYRIIYVIIGATVAELSARLVPYKIEDGIKELIKEIDKLNAVLEQQGIASLEGKENKHYIRDTIIHSAVLCQKLSMKNESYKDPKVATIINVNTEFAIRLGHKLLRNT